MDPSLAWIAKCDPPAMITYAESLDSFLEKLGLNTTAEWQARAGGHAWGHDP
jgi:hypothetical protein